MKKSTSRNNSSKKSNVLYSIPCGCVLALLLVGAISLINSGSCSAVTSASLSLSNPNMTSSATQGTTAQVSTKVNVSVSGAKDYSLVLKVDQANLTNGDTTIVPGNAITNNTWGYKWDKDANTSSYKFPSTTGTNLTVPTLTNGTVNFEGTLTFAAKFADNANAGSYKNEGSIMLTATPNSVTLSSIENMQDMTPEICVASTLEETKQLKDTRDNKTYWVTKLKDGNCWMTQNLDYDMPNETITSLPASVTSIPSAYDPGEKVISGNSFVNLGSQSRHLLVGNYYSFVTATNGSAGMGAGVASDSICPSGWRLPTGGDDGEYAVLANGLNANSLQTVPYYFVLNGGFDAGATSSEGVTEYYFSAGSTGSYWTATHTSVPYTYIFRISASSVSNTTTQRFRNSGAIRCIAQ